MDRDAAAEALAGFIYRVGIEESIGVFYELLSEPDGAQRELWDSERQWFNDQPDEVKRIVHFLIKWAKVSSLFDLATCLDGAGGPEEVDGHWGFYTVALNLTAPSVRPVHGIPVEAIEVCPTNRGEDVHDIFMGMVNKADASGKLGLNHWLPGRTPGE